VANKVRFAEAKLNRLRGSANKTSLLIDQENTKLARFLAVFYEQ